MPRENKDAHSVLLPTYCAHASMASILLFLNYAHVNNGMASHSSTLPWKIPRTEEPGRLQSMGSLRVGHN